MDEASKTLSQTPLRPNGPIDERPFMLHISALYAAREAVKLRLKREGYIVSHYRAAAITQMARDLFNSDRERLLAEARAKILASPRRRADWERAGLKYERQLAQRRASA